MIRTRSARATASRPKSVSRLALETLEAREVPSISLTGVEFRTIDGTGNNLDPARFTQGAADTQQIRNGYGDQFPDPAPGSGLREGDLIVGPNQANNLGFTRQNARTISNAIGAQTVDARDQRGLTDWHMLWGQFITHDLGLTESGPQFNALGNGTVGNFDVPVTDPSDPLGPNPIRFNRSEFIIPTTGTARREVINTVTSYIDANTVYGSDPVRQAALREFSGGRLRTSAGNLMPFNTAGLPNDNPFGAPAGSLFLAGDTRANEQVGLMAVHTLFVREHNRLAGVIAQQNPAFTDEQIYQTARRIVGAQIQIITYEEYLPALLGWERAPDPNLGTYNVDFFRPTNADGTPRVANAATTNAFAHAGFRFAHSQINDLLLLVNNANQQVGSLTLRQAFFNPSFLTGNPGNLDLILKGQAAQVAQAVDNLYANGVRNNLFRPGGGGTDLLTFDVQRGRDHGLPDYVQLRRQYGAVVGITEADITEFSQISSDPVQERLRQISGNNIRNIDPIIGILAEDHLPGSSAGVLLTRMMQDQFSRSRDGDRFFYTRDPFLQQAGVRSVVNLDNVTLSNIIRWNTGVTNIQDNAFFERSVVVIEAPRTGSNMSLVAAGGLLTVIDTQNGQVRAVRSLADVTRVILVGSQTAPDRFNLFMAGANGGLERGVEVWGGRGVVDELNVFGRPFQNDVFFASPGAVSVNGNRATFFGIEQLRLITLGGNDSINIAPNMNVPVQTLDFFNPFGPLGGSGAAPLSGGAASSSNSGGGFGFILPPEDGGVDFAGLLGIGVGDDM